MNLRTEAIDSNIRNDQFYVVASCDLINVVVAGPMSESAAGLIASASPDFAIKRGSELRAFTEKRATAAETSLVWANLHDGTLRYPRGEQAQAACQALSGVQKRTVLSDGTQFVVATEADAKELKKIGYKPVADGREVVEESSGVALDVQRAVMVEVGEKPVVYRIKNTDRNGNVDVVAYNSASNKLWAYGAKTRMPMSLSNYMYNRPDVNGTEERRKEFDAALRAAGPKGAKAMLAAAQQVTKDPGAWSLDESMKSEAYDESDLEPGKWYVIGDWGLLDPEAGPFDTEDEAKKALKPGLKLYQTGQQKEAIGDTPDNHAGKAPKSGGTPVLPGKYNDKSQAWRAGYLGTLEGRVFGNGAGDMVIPHSQKDYKDKMDGASQAAKDNGTYPWVETAVYRFGPENEHQYLVGHYTPEKGETPEAMIARLVQAKKLDGKASDYSLKARAEEASSERLVQTLSNGDRTAKIYKDTEWDTHRVKFYVGGKYQSNADSEDDKQGCVDTAKSWIAQAKESQHTDQFMQNLPKGIVTRATKDGYKAWYKDDGEDSAKTGDTKAAAIAALKGKTEAKLSRDQLDSLWAKFEQVERECTEAGDAVSVGQRQKRSRAFNEFKRACAYMNLDAAKETLEYMKRSQMAQLSEAGDPLADLIAQSKEYYDGNLRIETDFETELDEYGVDAQAVLDTIAQIDAGGVFWAGSPILEIFKDGEGYKAWVDGQPVDDVNDPGAVGAMLASFAMEDGNDGLQSGVLTPEGLAKMQGRDDLHYGGAQTEVTEAGDDLERLRQLVGDTYEQYKVDDGFDADIAEFSIDPAQVLSAFEAIKGGQIFWGGSPTMEAFVQDGQNKVWIDSDEQADVGDDLLATYLMLYASENGDPNAALYTPETYEAQKAEWTGGDAEEAATWFHYGTSVEEAFIPRAPGQRMTMEPGDILHIDLGTEQKAKVVDVDWDSGDVTIQRLDDQENPVGEPETMTRDDVEASLTDGPVGGSNYESSVEADIARAMKEADAYSIVDAAKSLLGADFQMSTSFDNDVKTTTITPKTSPSQGAITAFTDKVKSLGFEATYDGDLKAFKIVGGISEDLEDGSDANDDLPQEPDALGGDPMVQ